MLFPVEPVELFLVITNFPNKLIPNFKKEKAHLWVWIDLLLQKFHRYQSLSLICLSIGKRFAKTTLQDWSCNTGEMLLQCCLVQVFKQWSWGLGCFPKRWEVNLSIASWVCDFLRTISNTTFLYQEKPKGHVSCCGLSTKTTPCIFLSSFSISSLNFQRGF